MKNKFYFNKSLFIMSLHAMRKKPIRLALTILLLVCCLTIIGIGACAAAIDIDKTTLDGYYRGGDDILYVFKHRIPSIRDEDTAHDPAYFSRDDLNGINNRNFDVDPIYKAQFDKLKEMNTSSHNLYISKVSGWVSVTDAFLHKYNYPLLADSRLPNNETEVAISLYHYESFVKNGYYGKRIAQYGDLLGEKISSDYFDIQTDKVRLLTIVGIIDTRFNMNRYALLNENKSSLPDEEYLRYGSLADTLDSALGNGFHGALFVHPDYIENAVFTKPLYTQSTYPSQTFTYNHIGQPLTESSTAEYDIHWAKDEHVLNDNEIIVSSSELWRHRIFTKDDMYVEDNDEYIQGDRKITVSLSNVKNDNTARGSVFNIVGYFEDDFMGNPLLPENLTTVFFSDNTVKNMTSVPNDFGNAVIGGIRFSGNYDSDMSLIKFASDAMDDTFEYKIIGELDYDLSYASFSANFYKKLGFYVGLVSSVFAALMMFNFVAATIAVKKKNIGIMRALGCNKIAVAEIFFIEGLFTSVIAAVFACVATAVGCILLNALPAFVVMRFRIFFFTPIQALILFGVGILIALLGALIPVCKISGKKPNELIGK